MVAGPTQLNIGGMHNWEIAGTAGSLRRSPDSNDPKRKYSPTLSPTLDLATWNDGASLRQSPDSPPSITTVPVFSPHYLALGAVLLPGASLSSSHRLVDASISWRRSLLPQLLRRTLRNHGKRQDPCHRNGERLDSETTSTHRWPVAGVTVRQPRFLPDTRQTEMLPATKMQRSPQRQVRAMQHPMLRTWGPHLRPRLQAPLFIPPLPTQSPNANDSFCVSVPNVPKYPHMVVCG